MILISGIHGVGKSYFCEKVKHHLGLNSFSASVLIAELKQEQFHKDKLIKDIDNNQGYLLAAVNRLNETEKVYLLDGHLCLLNAEGQVQRICLQTFLDLKPQGMVLLTEESSVIAERRKIRDGIDHDTEQIKLFQNEEVAYAGEISRQLKIPLFISNSANDIERAMNFIRSFQK